MAYYYAGTLTTELLYEQAFERARRDGKDPKSVLRQYPPQTAIAKASAARALAGKVPVPQGTVGRAVRWLVEPRPGATLAQYYDATPLSSLLYAFEMQSGVGASATVYTRAERLLSVGQLAAVVALRAVHQIAS